ncbi:hypothetical protein CP556_12135 [Natrinema sp. CBA1119]|uniref:DUF7289 family protein n=1 Tax=Natrinema sp. CBA1119 TaxID=1608465 RepID=UPI000BF91062|nr:hypothetical protein [Natrinema sp. CBA1119]PGF16792.1 hypothetical protein CP556_12135 [Natrinema sp. CBA1119]
MNSRGEGHVTVTSNRGQSAVLSLVILIGMVATVSVGILIVAGDVMSSAEQQSEHDRVEQAFVELSHTMSTVSASDDTPRSVQFEAGESGAVTKTKAGWVTIRGGGVNITQQPMGAIEYEGGDGTIISYQSGGVWRETGNQTRMLSAPNINYNSEDDTLWFPITTLSGEQSLDSGEISVKHTKTNPMRHVSFVKNDSVTITIQSDYYRGWERYFRTEAGGTSIQNIDHENRTITVLLGYADLEGAFDEGATIGSDDPNDFYDKHDNFGNDHRTGTPLPEMDTVIDQMVADAKTGEDVDENLSNGSYTSPIDDGTYFIEEIDGDEDYEFDLTNGNATLIVENDVNLEKDGSIRVVNRDDGNVLRIYAGGNDTVIKGDICDTSDGGTCSDDAGAIQFYGSSTMSVDFGPGNTGAFEGVLYVSSNEEKDWWDGSTGKCSDSHQVHMQGGGDFFGSIVAYSACAQSNSVSFDYDSNLKNANIDPYSGEYPLPPQITYLNVAVHELDVQNK